MNTDNIDKEPKETAAENVANEIETAEELSIEEQLQEDLAKEKDKFLRLFAEFENYKKNCF